MTTCKLLPRLILGLWAVTSLCALAQSPAERTNVESLPEQMLIYHPTKGRQVAPEALKLGVRDLYFPSEDGVRLNAWWMPPPKDGPVVLYFHGNGGNLSGMRASLNYFKLAGVGAMIIDYRGYGLSEGYPSEEGLYRDARAAYAQCTKLGVKPNKLVIHGQSLGGAVALNLASERSCAGLVLESTFSNAHDMAVYLYGESAAKTLHSRFDGLKKVAKLHCPVLIIHGDQDSDIPVQMGRALHQAARKPKRLWIVPGANHGNLRIAAGKEYLDQLGRFLEETGANRKK